MTEPTVENPKVSATGWAPLPGWTVLFDRLNGVPLVPYDASAGGEHALHEGQAVTDLGEMLRREGGEDVAVLPYSTHHVTVCDGIHERMLQGAPRKTDVRVLRTGDVDQFPAPLVDALAALLAAAAPGGTFSVADVERRNFAIVVGVEPVDDPTRKVVADISEARATFLDVLGDVLGRDLSAPWEPHITLGYLRRRPPSADLEALVGRLDEAARASTTWIELAGAGFYRFRDMNSFRRTSWPEADAESARPRGLGRLVSRWRP